MDPANPTAEALAWNDEGVITAVGNERDVLALTNDKANIIDAAGAMVLPGFIDTHLHVPEAGINEGLCPLPPGETLKTYAALIEDCAAEQTDQDWVLAAGASLFGLRNSINLPIEVLDKAVPDRPALILDDLGHAVWTNSLGLTAAGISADATDPQGGIFLRDENTDELTGLFLEDAQQVIRNAAAANADTNYEGLLIALDELARNGLTTVSDAGGYWAQNHPDAWYRAQSDDTLSVRAINSLYLYPNLDFESQLAEFEKRFDNNDDNLLRFNTAKIYIDGILDLGTAALLEPYDEPVDPNFKSGFEYFESGQLNRYVAALNNIGYKMNFHVIGDRAVRIALDAIKSLDEHNGQLPARPHRTTHTYMVHADDVPRFAQLGVAADLQVGEDSTNVLYHEDLSLNLGDRAFDLLPVTKLMDANAAVSLSSDWDADPLSPFGIIERALTRETFNVDNVETAIQLVTSNAAHALGVSDITGSLTIGKHADFIIINQNLVKIPIDEISKTKVLSTVLQGFEVYRANGY